MYFGGIYISTYNLLENFHFYLFSCICNYQLLYYSNSFRKLMYMNCLKKIFYSIYVQDNYTFFVSQSLKSSRNSAYKAHTFKILVNICFSCFVNIRNVENLLMCPHAMAGRVGYTAYFKSKCLLGKGLIIEWKSSSLCNRQFRKA